MPGNAAGIKLYTVLYSTYSIFSELNFRVITRKISRFLYHVFYRYSRKDTYPIKAYMARTLTQHMRKTYKYFYVMLTEPSKCSSCLLLAGLVAQSVMSATDTLGPRDVRGLSAIDPHPRQWISVCTMPKDVGMLL